VLVSGTVEPSLEEIRDYVTQSLDSTAAPRELHIIDELPRLGIGKLDRRALALRFENGGDLPGGYGW